MSRTGRAGVPCHHREAQWGAFYGTELDVQLRRRGNRTIGLGGIATHIGMESTARDAYARGYQQTFAEDAMSDLHAETRGSTCRHIFCAHRSNPVDGAGSDGAQVMDGKKLRTP
ncbi:isochorismatase family protein [Caballeronia sp. LZ062]|uniref:isochorismatase family protein n=1 Tax=unclassified Caballeronia TaxID=2646786 RepID=UPI00285D096C|nr:MULTISPECIES: isochorismatase family protein [unclassified Caballeronia]MDR5856848.1 isochorismatase family protein [Caballeronia sp. LZ050]MDR5869755.1 isochorismatase family protein [Caballeronia sp. LZ062]